MTLDSTAIQIISNVIVLFGVIVAICTIIYNIRTAKKTQTANFLFESRQDKEYLESLHLLRRIHRFLNFYERVAVSIREGIYDERMIKRTSFTTVVTTYDIAEPLIKAIREDTQSKTAYQEFEWLVKRWKARPLEKDV